MGSCPFPLVLGYEILGEVSLLGSYVKDFKKGEIVGFGIMRDCCEKCKYLKKVKENLCLTGFHL